MKTSLDIVYEISKLIKKSPKEICFSEIHARNSWLHLDLVYYVLQDGLFMQHHYKVYWITMKYFFGHGRNQMMVTRELESSVLNLRWCLFDFLFRISLGSLVLRHSDNLSKSPQHESMYVSSRRTAINWADYKSSPISQEFWSLQDVSWLCFTGSRSFRTELCLQFYKDDLSKHQLQVQLPLLKSFIDRSNTSELTMHIINLLSKISATQRL